MKKTIKSFANFLDRNVFPITIPLAIGMLFLTAIGLLFKLIEHFGYSPNDFGIFALYVISTLIGLPIYSWLINKLFHQR